MKLNLGCSDAHLTGYVNVDKLPPADVIMDLSRPWLWADNYVDEIRAYDIIEHLPSKVLTMNEAWRVLKPRGLFMIEVPTTDGRGAFQDPTHVSFWSANDLRYYQIGKDEHTRFAVSYGIQAKFKVLGETHRLVGPAADNVWKLHAVLEAVK